MRWKQFVYMWVCACVCVGVCLRAEWLSSLKEPWTGLDQIFWVDPVWAKDKSILNTAAQRSGANGRTICERGSLTQAMLINGALTCWNMKNTVRRYDGWTEEPTEWQTELPPGRKTLQRNVCFARDPFSASADYRDVFFCYNIYYATGHTSHHQRVLHLSAGQCSGAPASWDDLERKTPAFILLDL